MRYDDDYDDDFPGRPRTGGVAAGWRVAAVFSFVLVAVLAVLLMTACVALVERSPVAPQPVDDPPPPLVHFDPPHEAAAHNDDADGNADPRLLPYPTAQDLRPQGVPPAVAGEVPAAREPDARERFLRAGEVVWTSNEPFGPDVVLVSPDGASIAYGGAQGLMVGPPRAPELVEGTEPHGGGPAARRGAERPTVSAWWSGSHAFNWSAPDGRLATAHLMPGRGAEVLPIDWARGRYAVPVPPEEKEVVVVRHRARPKLEGPARQAPPDPAEVVVTQPGKDVTRILIPAGTAVWRAPAVAPDGKRLALVSDSGHEAALPRLWRVFVIDLGGGEPRPLTPPAPHVGTACWTADGKSLVYARGAASAGNNPPGADTWRTDLFEVDPATGREKPLTVGGGFSSPSVSRTGDLYALAQSGTGGEAKTRLIRLPLAKARELAAAMPATGRGAKAWAELAAAALREAELPPDAGPQSLDEAKVKRLAAAAARAYRERFGGAAPDTAADLDRLLAEVRRLGLPQAERNRLGLVVGALTGEYLRRKHGARWALVAKVTGEPLADPAAHELFRHIVNPFDGSWSGERDEDDEPAVGSLAWALAQAEGRPIVLAAEPTVRTHLPAADPDLARGTALLKEGRADEAERLLLAMAGRHAGNYHLALHVGSLLSEHGRKAAVRKLAQGLKADALKDARVYNFVGVSLLEDDPAAAVIAFKNALRCNLYEGPAYFNLAQAYEKLNDPASARLCLQRYLKLMSWGPLADDARRRLGELPPEPPRQ
jgi:tetratricopeptide (TPR) repeat protein